MSVINEVKQKVDIVELVSDYVQLQKAGQNFKALCPFHTEKHPSFFVFPKQQSWHCFGACGSGGDVFSFIMKKEGGDFGQALRLLAERAGVPLMTPKMREETEGERERLSRINEAAAEYYHHLLLNTPSGGMARDYVVKRGLSPQIIKDFQLGFSPDSWEALRQYLAGKGYEDKELVAAGLVIEREGGSGYDRFRNRLMFPIRDVQGRVTGFGGRALDDSLPKYLNSPQTLIFDKSDSLYGIDRAKAAIRHRNLAVIVEGYMDVLIAHQYGWENVVACMGTSVTERQLAMLKRLTKNLALALDADAAGEEATLRSVEVVSQALDKKVVPIPTGSGLVKYENTLDVELKVIVLPQGKDPDDMIREDVSRWQHLVENAPPVVDFAFDTVIGKVDLDQVRDKSLAVEKLLPLISEIKDPIRQSHYLQKLARLLKISERNLESALRELQRSQKRYRTDKRVEELAPRGSPLPLSSPLEEYCLALLLRYAELRITAGELLPEYFEYSENREIFLKWQQASDLTSLRASLTPALQEYTDHLLTKVFPPAIQVSDEKRRQTMSECIRRLQEKLLMNLKTKNEELLILEAEAGGEAAELTKLDRSLETMEQGTEISARLKEVWARQKNKRGSTLTGRRE